MAENSNNSIQNQQELQQSLLYLEYLKEQITNLNEQSEVLELALKEHNMAKETLNNLNNLEKDNQILVPIGADSLVFAKVVDDSKVIINIGAGIAIEDKIGEASKKLTSRIKSIGENQKKIKETVDNLQEQAILLSSQIEEKYKTLKNASNVQPTPGQTNVS